MCLSENHESNYLQLQGSWSLQYTTQLPRENTFWDISFLIRFVCLTEYLICLGESSVKAWPRPSGPIVYLWFLVECLAQTNKLSVFVDVIHENKWINDILVIKISFQKLLDNYIIQLHFVVVFLSIFFFFFFG